MISVNVQSDIDKIMPALMAILDAKNMRFAIAKALTQTAKDVQQEVKKNIPSRFVLRRDWIVRQIKITPATKDNLESTVFSADKFMGLQQYGGDKTARRNFIAIPTSLVKRTKTDVIKKSDRPNALGDKAEVIKFNGHYWLALKRNRKSKLNGAKLRLLYLLIPAAKVKQRLRMDEDGRKIARAKFIPNLQAAIEYAAKTAR